MGLRPFEVIWACGPLKWSGPAPFEVISNQ